jgi:ABC-2 type transport system ATP-binding protein
MKEFVARASGSAVRVRTPSTDQLVRAVSAKGATAGVDEDGSIEVRGMTSEEIGDLAFSEGLRLHELATVRASLEEAFMELTADSVEYHAGVPGQRPDAPITTTTIGSGV